MRIDSSIGSSKVAGNMKHLVVDEPQNNEEQVDNVSFPNPAEIEQLYRQAKAQEARPQMPQKEKLFLEKLLGVFENSKKIKIRDIVFTIKILDDDEELDVYAKIFERQATNVDTAYLSRRYTLAHAITKINEVPINMLTVQRQANQTDFDIKVNFLKQLPAPVVSLLFDKYTEFKTEMTNEITAYGEGINDNLKK